MSFEALFDWLETQSNSNSFMVWHLQRWSSLALMRVTTSRNLSEVKDDKSDRVADPYERGPDSGARRQSLKDGGKDVE